MLFLEEVDEGSAGRYGFLQGAVILGLRAPVWPRLFDLSPKGIVQELVLSMVLGLQAATQLLDLQVEARGKGRRLPLPETPDQPIETTAIETTAPQHGAEVFAPLNQLKASPKNARKIVLLRPQDGAAWLSLQTPQSELLRALPAGSLNVEKVFPIAA